MMAVVGGGHSCCALAAWSASWIGAGLASYCSRVTTYCNDDGVRDHHGEHSNQREEHADSIPSHLQLSVASRRMAFSLRRTAWRQRRSHELILPCEGS